MNDMVKAVIAYKALDHFVTSAGTRKDLDAEKMSQEQLDYQRQRDRDRLDYQRSRDWQNCAMEKQRMDLQVRQSELEREQDDKRMWMEADMRDRDRRAARDMQEQYLDYEAEQRERDRKAWLKNEKAKIEARQEEFRQLTEAERNRLDVAQDIERQRILHTERLAAFNAKSRSALTRENTLNNINEEIVSDMLRNFPLVVSPVSIIGEKELLVQRLSRNHQKDTFQETIDTTCRHAPVTIVFAPLTSLGAEDSSKLWDRAFRQIDSFFLRNYDGNGIRPVMMYGNAWKDGVKPGPHATNAIHFFLSDTPCIVVEPIVEEQDFTLIVSSWQIGNNGSLVQRGETSFTLPMDLDSNRLCKHICNLVSLNIALLVDIHFWISASIYPLFPELFEEEMPDVFADKGVRSAVALNYGQACSAQRVEESLTKYMERSFSLFDVKEKLRVIDSEQRQDFIMEHLKIYARIIYKHTATSQDDLWDCLIEHFEKEDAPLFHYLLPTVADRRIYKRIDRRLSKLRR